MRVEFKVYGSTGEEIESAAINEAARFFGRAQFIITHIEADALVAQSGSILGYQADVRAETK